MDTSTTHIAVFGDPHGHFRLMFEICRRWQLANALHLDGILVCGDIGYFPDPSRIDKATKGYAKRDPEELGIAEFFRRPQPLRQDPLLEETLLGPPADLGTVRCDVICCHGNHEDFEELDKATGNSAIASIDCFDRIKLLRSGEVTSIAGIRIAALGGAPETETSEDELLGKYVSAQGANRLLKQSFDILLTHGSPRAIGGESDRWGSRLIRNVIESCQPAYNFFGHHRSAISPAIINHTGCFWFNDVNFQRVRSQRHIGPLEPRCMGILEWKNPSKHSLKIVDDPWFRALTGINWQHR